MAAAGPRSGRAAAGSARRTAAHLFTASSPRCTPPHRLQVHPALPLLTRAPRWPAPSAASTDPAAIASSLLRPGVAAALELRPWRRGSSSSAGGAGAEEQGRARQRVGSRARPSRWQAQTALLPPPPLFSLLPPPSPAWGHGGPRGETAATSAHGARRPRRSAAAASARGGHGATAGGGPPRHVAALRTAATALGLARGNPARNDSAWGTESRCSRKNALCLRYILTERGSESHYGQP